MKRTPCIGICSTTYGDVVCRGCKRFAHEIDQWNAYDDDQRHRIWSRLLALRTEAVGVHLEVADADRLEAAAQRLRVPELNALDSANVAYEVLRRAGNETDFVALGIRVRVPATRAVELFGRIERELYERSVAHYERNFRVPVQ